LSRESSIVKKNFQPWRVHGSKNSRDTWMDFLLLYKYVYYLYSYLCVIYQRDVYKFIHIHSHSCIFIYIYIYIYVYMYICIYVYMYINMCLYVHMYMHMCLFVCIYICYTRGRESASGMARYSANEQDRVTESIRASKQLTLSR